MSFRPRLRPFQIRPDLTACADVIALFVVGVLLVLLFVAWQYYLERRLENPDLPRTRWTAPPLMKPSMWTRAHGRFAVMQIIACINWAAFTIWIVWAELYYQTYLNLSPIHTMLRLLPMSTSGIVANVLIALMIGRIDVMYIVATGTLCGRPVRRDRSERTILGVRIPCGLYRRARRRFHVRVRHAIHR